MNLVSGYKLPYDPFPVLERLNSDRDSAISELWENLYHQGDVGSASYAAVPQLVEKGELSLVASIECARLSEHNPKISESFEQEYFNALNSALESQPNNEEHLQGFYVIHASMNGQPKLAKALNLLSVEEILSEYA